MSLANIASSNADENDDYDEDRRHVARSTASAASELLAEAALAAALPRGPARILTDAGRVVIVVVPSAGYVAPMGLVLEARNPAARLHLVTEKKKNSWSDDSTMPHFAAGRTVLAVTQDPALLRPSVHAAADLVVPVGPLDAGTVRRIINTVTGGRARDLSDADIVGRDIDEIAAAIRPGSTARECVQRLKRISSGMSSPADTAPDLAALPLFGEAKSWAADAVVELERLRRGEIAASELEHVLLHGPPGTGKTLLARALAKAAGVRFFDTSVSAWFTGSNGHLDGVLKAANDFFQTLLDNAPCVGLLDELEALPDRAALDARHREWWNSVITGTLLMVTRVRESGKPVLLVGASNYANRIDAALTRPGRLGRHVLVRPAETEAECATLLRYYLADDLDPDAIANASSLAGHATPAQVEGWVRAARRVARDANRPLILDDLLGQIAPPDRRSEADLRNVALHEAGHAVAALVLQHQLQRVSIVADGAIGGVTTWRPLGLVHTMRDIEDQVAIVLAGRAADQVLGAGADSGAASDLEFATMRLAAAEANLGLRDGLAHRADDSGLRYLLRADLELLARVEAQLRNQMRRADALVGLYSDAIVAVAETLVARRVLSGADVSAIVARSMQAGQTTAAAEAKAADLNDAEDPEAQLPGLRG